MTTPPEDYEDLKDWVINHPLEAAQWIDDQRDPKGFRRHDFTALVGRRIPGRLERL